MKIWCDKEIYDLPNNDRIIYDNNDYMIKIFKLLDEYINSKRSNINIIDNNGDKISKDDIFYININDISKIKQYLSITSKSIYKDYLIETIKENDKMFLSIYESLNLLRDSITDIGFIKIKSILFNGVENKVDFYQNRITVKEIANLFELNIEELTDVDICIIYLNMMSKLNKGKRIIVNLTSCIISKQLLKWQAQTTDNLQMFISNDIINKVDIFDMYKFNILVLNNKEDIEYLEINKKYFETFLFSLLPIVTSNIQFLAQKIININKIYYESNQNILISFDTNTLDITFT
ncbi:MAG: hypothetical protein ACK5KQ_03940 [Anaerorhabdus sp.]